MTDKQTQQKPKIRKDNLIRIGMNRWVSANPMEKRNGGK